MELGVRDRQLHERYPPDAVSVFDADEVRRFFNSSGCPVDAQRVDWELLYRHEPHLYDRLIAGEHLHPAIWQWLPAVNNRALELGAGTGRLTIPLAARCREVIAVEPARPLMKILGDNLADNGIHNVVCTRGFFDAVPVPSSSCDIVISCSAFVPQTERDPEACLQEMERCCIPGGMVVVVWPSDDGWFEHHGFTRVEFPGRMTVDFGTFGEAAELARIFYPHAVAGVLRRASPQVAYETLGMRPPRTLCWKTVV